ncbi:hypothetical protein [Legionella micdadei]|uniref:Uncharacterized protein n=1 Tax=Legionella micdadei TaxID=451 RepID=A0A098GD82_LEGMI|nr:hypothetical protein [Legionella micdadei]ARG96231.1 hypothetical protein B6N58_00155 [Legionella micdadei]KTD29043.1 hypothetical protein Lmic_0963 [Legionella micdadei]CEG59406.1 conserved exported protein of unknown function [Legionella micdadei]SCY00259.1 hypothetical protein SAMN02982997_00568 [Legionella micdadei]
MRGNRIFLHNSSNGIRIILLSFAFAILPLLSYAAQDMGMREGRYCEVIIRKTLTTFAVYNTWGLNHCPENLWKGITVTQIKKETGSSFVHLNGPRYWVIDGFINTNLINPAIKTFNGIAMREAGVLHLGLSELFSAGRPYQKHQVQRKTTWIYQSGKPVYELIDPQGNVFVMQSYSVQKVAQKENSLSQLGTKLKLPKGWQFKTGILKNTETIKAINQSAIVVQDDLLNTYQQSAHDVLQ